MSSPDYVYHKCLERKLTDKSGCQPAWLDITKSTTNKTCTREKLRKYLWNMAAVNYFGPKTILLKYGCLRPCEFYEFKVTILETFTVEK